MLGRKLAEDGLLRTAAGLAVALRRLSVRRRINAGEARGEPDGPVEDDGDGGRLDSRVSEVRLACHWGRFEPQLRSRSCSTA